MALTDVTFSATESAPSGHAALAGDLHVDRLVGADGPEAPTDPVAACRNDALGIDRDEPSGDPVAAPARRAAP